MRTTPLSRRAAWLLIGLSVALHLLTVFAFARQPDKLAAFTVMPIWVWGALGVILSSIATYVLRAPLPLAVTALWVLTTLLGSDEARVIGNLTKSPPHRGTPAAIDGVQPIRVITLNSSMFRFGDPSDDIAVWEPDIVILQEVSAIHVKKIADRLYGGHGDYRAFALNGIVTRWKIKREVRNPDPKFLYFNHNVTIEHPTKGDIEVANVHLSSASTNLRLWQKQCWRDHRDNRKRRQLEIAVALKILEETTTFPGAQPVIFAGDFNAPPSDPIQRLMEAHFDDAFRVAGTGWGNTFQRRIPILRLDRIHVTRQFTPVRCRAVTTRKSDHRMVVADLLLD
ncbi:endonuclease/exonuclease/phosphatase family protein [Haloferula chungangensis]|uniref:Endonuclease/exonuclease/phosphatase family protein n=1 Tax=Haloferula chungangensis TaxID=1048331 RepID=A0ABW2L056_9BACT